MQPFVQFYPFINVSIIYDTAIRNAPLDLTVYIRKFNEEKYAGENEPPVLLADEVILSIFIFHSQYGINWSGSLCLSYDIIYIFLYLIGHRVYINYTYAKYTVTKWNNSKKKKKRNGETKRIKKGKKKYCERFQTIFEIKYYLKFKA